MRALAGLLSGVNNKLRVQRVFDVLVEDVGWSL